jgi:hypothetical protein
MIPSVMGRIVGSISQHILAVQPLSDPGCRLRQLFQLLDLDQAPTVAKLALPRAATLRLREARRRCRAQAAARKHRAKRGEAVLPRNWSHSSHLEGRARCAPQRRSIWRNKKDHFGRANLFYIDEQEIVTYTTGVMIEVAVLEFHALPCQASWSLDAGISLNAAETSFRRFSTCRIFGSVC